MDKVDLKKGHRDVFVFFAYFFNPLIKYDTKNVVEC